VLRRHAVKANFNTQNQKKPKNPIQKTQQKFKTRNAPVEEHPRAELQSKNRATVF
jgi:hypothetical protein